MKKVLLSISAIVLSLSVLSGCSQVKSPAPTKQITSASATTFPATSEAALLTSATTTSAITTAAAETTKFKLAPTTAKKPAPVYGSFVSNSIANGFFGVSGDWIYSGLPHVMMKTKKDGSNQTFLLIGYCNSIHIIGDWIYYINQEIVDGDICKMKTDGSQWS